MTWLIQLEQHTGENAGKIFTLAEVPDIKTIRKEDTGLTIWQPACKNGHCSIFATEVETGKKLYPEIEYGRLVWVE